MNRLRRVTGRELFSTDEFDSIFQKIVPYESETRTLETLSEYILRNNLATGDLYPFINAVQTVFKATSNKIGRYNLQTVRSSKVMEENATSPEVIRETRFIKHLEDIFINVVGDTGLVGYMSSKFTQETIKIDSRIEGHYLVAFNILDGRRNLNDHLPVGSIFAIYLLNPEGDLDFKDLTGDSIVTAGYALYGTCTLLILAFRNGQGVHEFYLDQSLGEFTLSEGNKRIAKRGVYLSINEGITAGWDEATKIYVNRRKDPRFLNHSQSFYIGSLTADITRMLTKGGIFMSPPNIEFPEGKLGLLCDCKPMAYVLREAGGYATDGWNSILDVEANDAHQKAPFFGGSIEDVLSLMELKAIYKSKDY